MAAASRIVEVRLRLLIIASFLHHAVAMGPPARAWPRRQVIVGTAGLVGAEAAWREAVHAAAAGGGASLLPDGTAEAIESGRVVELTNWLPLSDIRELRADAQASFESGHFKADALAAYGQKKKGGFDPGSDRMVMPSFYPSKGTDGPWVDPSIGNYAARQRFKMRMGALKAELSRQLEGRQTLAVDGVQTHEMSYSRYGPGAFLPRHTDEHHSELKRKPLASASSTPSRPPPTTRRSVTWLVYLNEEWVAERDGGALRTHERAEPSLSHVGARGPDLQIGWLRATPNEGEQPVFLDARRAGTVAGRPECNCMLYVCAADGTKRDLSAEPFAASPALYISGGDFFARKLLVDRPADAERFHLIDSPKSAASALLPPVGETGEDGGERVRDFSPRAGTLILFDSVAIPHEVLPTKGRERFACSGWFHEQLFL